MLDDDFVPYEMNVEFYVFFSLMLNWVCGLTYGVDVVVVHDCSIVEWNMKFMKKISEPCDSTTTLATHRSSA